MITDSLLLLSSAQAVTATAFSTNTIDLGSNRDVGAGQQLSAQISVDTTVTAAGAATVRFEVVTSANANLSTPTVIAASGDVPKASLAIGARVVVDIPDNYITPLGQRYLGVQYTVSTGPLTAGNFTATILNGEQDVQKSYPSGYTVL